MTIDPVGEFDPVAFLESSVEIPSHEEVDQMRRFLCDVLEENGAEASVDEAGNVLATRGPREDFTAHYVLNTHIDTVSPHVPLERDAGIVRGRGACDAKGCLASLLAAFLAVDPGSTRLTLAVTPDEEVLSTGAHALVSDPEGPFHGADGVIVGEPTGLDVCTAAKGRFEGTIHLEGANAHAAEPETGTNAIAALEPVIRALETFDEREGGIDEHSELGSPTLTPTVVAGGDATNQVPADCELTVDRRSVPPETAATFEVALLEHLERAVPSNVSVSFAFTDRPTPFLEAWDTDSDGLLVRTLASAAAEAGFGGGGVRPFTAATEASYFAKFAPTVVFGPGVLADADGAVAHAPREYVRIADVHSAAEAIAQTLDSLE